MQWRTLPDWPRYQVSERGDVRRVTDGAWRKPYLSSHGYLYIVVRREGARRATAVHRLVAMAFLGPAPSPAHQVAHADGDRTNNDHRNLRWCSRSENERDKVAHGRSNRGERQWMARLTEASAREAKRLLASGCRPATVATRLGVARQTINAIREGRSWAWL